ncbi:hypothetical protein DFAR_2910041 [Desulfarculales bacterium]
MVNGYRLHLPAGIALHFLHRVILQLLAGVERDGDIQQYGHQHQQEEAATYGIDCS